MTRVRTPHLAFALAAVALFVALGGPAYAAKVVKKTIDGKTIKAKSITGKQLADRAVTLAKLDPNVRASRQGAPGPTGPAGPAGTGGQHGAAGASGAAGGLDVVDAQHRRIGSFAGFYASAILVRLDSGAELAYDYTASDAPSSLTDPTLYFQAADCAGQPYSGVAIQHQAAVILSTTAAPGSPIWIPRATPAISFTSLSRRTASGCTNGSTSANTMFPVDEAGTVPAVQKPLAIVPRS